MSPRQRERLRRISAKTKLLAAILAILAMGTCVNFVLVGLSLHRVSGQARSGQLANQRQCRLFPVSRKLYAGGYRYGLITRAEYELYLNIGSPQGCRPAR